MPQDRSGRTAHLYRRREDVIVTDLHDELVLLDPTTAEMYSLGVVGRLIWQALPETPDQLASHVCAAFKVDHAAALEDIQHLLHDLHHAGLVDAHAI